MKVTFAILAAACILPSAAAAADRHSWRIGNEAFHIYYSDLDMNTSEGRREMLARTESAARKLCVSRLRAEEDECVQATLKVAARAPGNNGLALAMAEQEKISVATR